MVMRRLALFSAIAVTSALALVTFKSSPALRASLGHGLGQILQPQKAAARGRTTSRRRARKRARASGSAPDPYPLGHQAIAGARVQLPESVPAAKNEAFSEPDSPAPETWSAAEIEAAAKDCDKRLPGLDASYDRLPPIREGVCGTPAPVRLRGFSGDRHSFLSFSPEPIVTCRLAESLQQWLNGTVQPAAELHLHSRIVRLTNLSAYSCRMRYYGRSQKLSEHARANAVDIGEFITAAGGRVSVLEGWKSSDERSAFLHAVHDGACEIFGTTLGPDANSAHVNHFHLDAKERRHPLCDFTPEQVRERAEAQRLAAHRAEQENKAQPQGHDTSRSR
jgi:hypothetical protein